MHGLRRVLAVVLLVAVAVTHSPAAQPRKIYWGDEVPAGWTGKWPSDLLTVPERTGWTRTVSTLRALGAAERSVVYPVFKARRLP